MLIVKIELHSAITGWVSEIGRMVIANDGAGTRTRGNYTVQVMRRGTTHKVQKTGRVENYPRLAYSVWELIRRALDAAFGKTPPTYADTDVRDDGWPK